MGKTSQLWTPEALEDLSGEFEQKSAQEVAAWALEEFHPEIALSCSFGGPGGVVLVDMLTKIQPDARVFYLDTELLFRETHETRDKLIERYGIRPVAYRAALSPEDQAKVHGPELYARQPDLCCHLRKVLPMRQALEGLSAWITAIRRHQSPTRAGTGIVEYDTKFNLVKVNPLANWTEREVWSYIREHDVPFNSLHDRNYPSIGCWPCTRPVEKGEEPRAGRWVNFSKTECGLHE
ncbi:MAG: phosphoadenylyl-sulfate reductase [Nitrospinota bacterium]